MGVFNVVLFTAFVASLQQISSADRCPSSWISWGKDCYRFELVNKATWRDAEARCRTWGSYGRQSHLVSIHSKDEQQFIYEVYRLAVRMDPRDDWSPLLWTGLGVGSSHAQLIWTDNSNVDYLNWFPGEPNNNPHTGVEISHGFWKEGAWADAPNAARNNHFACKMPQ